MLSIDDLNANKACDTPFPMEVVNDAGVPVGVTIMVLGNQSDLVTKAVNKAVNERRAREASREMRSRSGKTADYEPIESDVMFGQRLAAARIAGWTGLSDPYTPENALRLCQVNQSVAAQVTAASTDMANFLKS